MTSTSSHEADEPIQVLVNDSTDQYYKSKLRAAMLEVFAYVLGALSVASGAVSLTIGVREDDRAAILVSIPVFIFGVIAFFTISAFAHLLANSAHQLRLMTYDFMLAHDPDEDDYS